MSDDAINERDEVLDDELDDEDEYDDEIAPEGNRILGARAREEPEAVEIDVEERRDDVQLLVHASPSDMGRLIGKRGRVIQALRQVVRAAGAAEGIKANVDVVE
jgi:hypothetical protein